jgi:hypothetical protein
VPVLSFNVFHDYHMRPLLICSSSSLWLPSRDGSLETADSKKCPAVLPEIEKEDFYCLKDCFYSCSKAKHWSRMCAYLVLYNETSAGSLLWPRNSAPGIARAELKARASYSQGTLLVACCGAGCSCPNRVSIVRWKEVWDARKTIGLCIKVITSFRKEW